MYTVNVSENVYNGKCAFVEQRRRYSIAALVSPRLVSRARRRTAHGQHKHNLICTHRHDSRVACPRAFYSVCCPPVRIININVKRTFCGPSGRSSACVQHAPLGIFMLARLERVHTCARVQMCMCRVEYGMVCGAIRFSSVD